MSRTSKEDCLMHSQIEEFISRFNREDIPLINRFCRFGGWTNDNWRSLSSYCPECIQLISTQNEKIKELWSRKEKHWWN